MSKIQHIEVSFPVPVDLPPGFERALDALIGMVTEAYEAQHPDRTMWPSGSGAKPLWREPEEPDFDHSTYFIHVAEREANSREIERRKDIAEHQAKRQRQERPSGAGGSGSE
jgi:hypothetical protein